MLAVPSTVRMLSLLCPYGSGRGPTYVTPRLRRPRILERRTVHGRSPKSAVSERSTTSGTYGKSSPVASYVAFTSVAFADSSQNPPVARTAPTHPLRLVA